MKLDNSLLQAVALLAAALLGAVAALYQQWGVVSGAITGFFAVLNIHPDRRPPNDPSQPDSPASA